MSVVRISIIIPAYNEERYLPACLDAIARQTERPYEVIVVDNNSSDRTAEVAQRYPFVKLLHESQQGVVYTRNHGLNAAKGQLLARIDADTILPPDWVATLRRVAARYPADAAFTGCGTYYDTPWPRLIGRSQVLFYQKLQWPAMRGATLYGANMILRRESWRTIKAACHTRNDIDEDVDLSLQLRKHGLTKRYDASLVAAMSLRRDKTNPISVASYISSWPRDYALNGHPVAAAYIALLTGILIIIATIGWIVMGPITILRPSSISATGR